jgi:hypothetical protein
VVNRICDSTIERRTSMSRCLVLPLSFVGFITLWSIGLYTDDEWALEQRCDFWNLPQNDQEMDGEFLKSKELDHQLELTRRYHEMTQELVAQVSDQRLCILEAAARFRDFFSQHPELKTCRLRAFASTSDPERFFQHLIESVDTALITEPSRREATVARLQMDWEGQW